jgi:hypothetical protein
MRKRIFGLSMLAGLLLMLTSVANASPVNFDLTIHCKETLRNDEQFVVIVDNKTIGAINAGFESDTAKSKKNYEACYNISTDIESQDAYKSAHDITILYMKDKNLSNTYDFLLKEHKDKNLKLQCYFNGVKMRAK